MEPWFEKTFQLSQRSTSVFQEFRAATSTFLTMSYILLVNPQILSHIEYSALNPKQIVISTALSSAVSCIMTGYLGNLPVGLAPGIGLSAYLTYGLVLGNGLTPQQAYTSCFVSGIILVIFSITGMSQIIMRMIPRSIKLATIVGMGMQIALVGMTSVKLVVPNSQTIVGLGPIDNYQIWYSLSGLLLIGTLLYHQIQGGILFGIIVMTILTWHTEHNYPTSFIQLPTALQSPSQFLDFETFNILDNLPGICSFLFIGIIDVSGVIFGMASLANITQPDGSIPGATATFISASLGSLISAATGGTPIIVYVESAAGIKEGGRTGLTAIFIGGYFLLGLFFAPVLSSVPVTATSPVAILVGAMMMSQAAEIDWDNMSEAIPAFLTAIIMPFTFSITNGIAFGLIAAGFFYVSTGQVIIDIQYKWNEMKSYWRRDEEVVGTSRTYGSIIEYDNNSSTDNIEMRNRNVPSHTIEYGDKLYVQNNPSSVIQSPIIPIFTQERLSYTDLSHSFMDPKPFVRAPSLILTKEETNLIRKSGGQSIDGSCHGGTSYMMQMSQGAATP